MEKSAVTGLRRFGLTVGGAWMCLGFVSWWRGHGVAPWAFWTAGVILIAGAAVSPESLGPVRQRWMQAAELLGRINTRVVLTAFFYLAVTPIGFLGRWFRDPLDRDWRNPRTTSRWVRRPSQPVDPASYTRQF